LANRPGVALRSCRWFHKIARDPAAGEGLLVDLFIEMHEQPPEEIILDLDATDDPPPSRQEGASSTATTIATAMRTSGWRGRLRRAHQNPLRLTSSRRRANGEWRYEKSGQE